MDVSEARRLRERTQGRLLGVDRASYRYDPRPNRNAELREELVMPARQKPRYGYGRLHAVPERRSEAVNVKRVHRLHAEERSGGAVTQAQAAGARSRCRAADYPCQSGMGHELQR